jgi:hypothetical protein
MTPPTAPLPCTSGCTLEVRPVDALKGAVQIAHQADILKPISDCMQVEEIALLNTTLMRPDGGRFLYPNIVMSTLGVVNIARSGPHNEAFSVSCMLHCAVHHSRELVAHPVDGRRHECL